MAAHQTPVASHRHCWIGLHRALSVLDHSTSAGQVRLSPSALSVCAESVGSCQGNDMRARRPKFHDADSEASDPGGVAVSHTRLRRFCPELYGLKGLSKEARRSREIIIEHMAFGDSRAAVVVGVEPLLVAAYTDELDCVAMLRFPPDASDDPLEIGSRLLAVNTYGPGASYSADLNPGPRQLNRWVKLYPIIADFICADEDRVQDRKNEIDEEEWERAQVLGAAYAAAHPGIWRDGAPCRSHIPAAPPP